MISIFSHSVNIILDQTNNLKMMMMNNLLDIPVYVLKLLWDGFITLKPENHGDVSTENKP
jgi:hypothetical protein